MTQHLDPVADKEQYLPYYPAPEPGPRPLADILADLRRPIHPDLLKTKQKKGNDITFIEWHSAYRILEKYAMGFHYRTRTSMSLDGQHVACDAEIGIVSSDYGVTWRGSSGSDEDDEKGYGDATDRAESQALRRAAAKFGLGLALYYDKSARTGRPAKQVQETRPRQQPQEPRNGAQATPNTPAPARAASAPAGAVSESAPQPITADQKEKIKRAISDLGWGSADNAAYLARFGVTLFSQLTAEQAAEVVPDLQAKAADFDALVATS